MEHRPSTTVGGGYTCSNCGQWVEYGDNHYCVSSSPTNPTPQFQITDNRWRDDIKRIADALERIAKSLEETIRVYVRK